MSSSSEPIPGGVAIVGLAGRFPGAADVDTFWRNLRAGAESIKFFSEAELVDSGVPQARFRDPNYVPASGFLPGTELFDAAFFGFTPREAENTDPQHRLFLECAWEALESAGYDPARYPGVIGVYAGCGSTSYLWRNVRPHRAADDPVADFPLMLGVDKDFLATRVSYKLDLKGPSLTIQTACSTSLVAVCVAFQALLTYQCDLALAGGVAIDSERRYGHLHREGLIFSPDGHCRAFDAEAQGTVGGEGVGIVALKRLEDALVDGDSIYGVIRGVATNNDGSSKIGFTAPSIAGQMRVIAQALAVADVPLESVSYIETHGTGTPLGDPIEIAALREVFRGARTGSIAIGSVKSNIGHLDTASGIAGLIKTVLALHHRELPPSLHVTRPHPKLELDQSPFYVNTRLSPWTASPRRAGVSSFGIGGTNAHVVLEEPPPIGHPTTPDRSQLLVLSARSDAALETATRNLASHLAAHPDIPLASVAYTLQVGRRAFGHRRALACRSTNEAIRLLSAPSSPPVQTRHDAREQRPVAFLFPGQGSLYPDTGRALYESEPSFREWLDRCAAALTPHLGLDVRRELFPPASAGREAGIARLRNTRLSQPLVFAIEYALARMWMDWGIRPAALLGHSVGEYVAACLSGVFSLEDALWLVAQRGKLMQDQPGGAMLAVPLSEEDLRPLLGSRLSLAVMNGPSMSVVAGPEEDVAELERHLQARGIESTVLQTSHAFHSAMMDPVVAPLRACIERVHRRAPQVPFVSNVTGTWITPEQAQSPAYWARHLRETVRFAAGLETLFQSPELVLLEVWPGETIAKLAKHHPARPLNQPVVSTLSRRGGALDDRSGVLNAVGELWLSGVDVDWVRLHGDALPRRVKLPTYPFERQRFWLPPLPKPLTSTEPAATTPEPAASKEWFYRPVWRERPLQAWSPDATETWLIFADRGGWGSSAARLLRASGHRVILVHEGRQSTSREDVDTISPHGRESYERLLRELSDRKLRPRRVLHLWSLAASGAGDGAVSGAQELTPSDVQAELDRGFYSLIGFSQALGSTPEDTPVSVTVVTSGLHRIGDEPPGRPIQAAVLGPCRVIPQEYDHIRMHNVDLPAVLGAPRDDVITELLAECGVAGADDAVAYRQGRRLLRIFEPATAPPPDAGLGRLRPRGVYLITGGLSGIGLELAGHLAQAVQARLVLIGRSQPRPDVLQRLRSFEGLGAEVLVDSADVADLDQMRAVAARARARFGRIDGVIHAAGVGGGGAVQGRSSDDMAAVLQPKVLGTLVLDAVTKELEPDFVVLCSSLTAVLGGYGQADYCAANAFLDAFAHHKHGLSRTLFTSINWDAWREVGMAARAAARGQRSLHPASILPASEALSTASYALLGERRRSAEVEIEFVAQVSHGQHWLFDEHHVRGRSTLPGTAYLELFASALMKIEPSARSAAEISDVVLLEPLTLAHGERLTVRTAVRRSEHGFELTVRSQSENSAVREHARGLVTALGGSGDTPIQPRTSIDSLIARCTEVRVPDFAGVDGPVRLGPRWRCLRRLWMGVQEGVAAIELPAELAEDLPRHPLHPAMLDTALSFAIMEHKGLYLPFGYERVRMHGPLPPKLYSHARTGLSGGLPPDTVRLDITLYSDTGSPIVEVEGYVLRRVHDSPR